MANMTTVLTEMVDNGTSRTYRRPTHTVGAPRLVIQKVRFPASTTAIAEDSFRLVAGLQDASGVPVVSKSNFECNFRRPANMLTEDVAAELAAFRDIVNSDEFTAMVTGQAWLKN